MIRDDPAAIIEKWISRKRHLGLTGRWIHE